MQDYGTRKTDLAVKRAEWRLSRVYHQAEQEIGEKLKAWQKGHEAREKRYRELLAQGKITQDDFNAWMRGQVFQGKQWQARQEAVRQVLYNADQVAANIINDGKLGVFADNANYLGYTLEHDSGINTGFMLYDEQTVARLIKSDPQILPKPRPGVQKDKAYSYYNKLMNSAITQGILQGEGIPEIAKRIAHTTGESSYKSAVRNARTAYTGAQNAGRIEGLHQAQSLGIKVKKRWMATLDSRTRDAHQHLDGQVQEVDDPFESDLGDIMYPGDPTADPANTYNCRCTLVYVYPEYPSEMERRDNETGEVIGDMTYDEWEKSKTAPTIDQWRKVRQNSKFARDRDSISDIGEIISTFGFENPRVCRRDITEFYQYAQHTDGMWSQSDAMGVHERMTTQTDSALNDLIDKLVSRTGTVDEELQRSYDQLSAYLRDNPLYMSKYDRANIPDFEGYRKSKTNHVRTTYDRSAVSVDTMYESLVTSYPWAFRDDAAEVSDRLQAINDGMNVLKASIRQSAADILSPEEMADFRSDLKDYIIAGFEASKHR